MWDENGTKRECCLYGSFINCVTRHKGECGAVRERAKMEHDTGPNTLKVWKNNVTLQTPKNMEHGEGVRVGGGGGWR